MASLLICEAALRVRAWIRYGEGTLGSAELMIQWDPELELHVHTPGYQRSGKRIDIGINSLGFRGDEFPVEKPPGVVRIVCLGGSTTFCGEASNNNRTWPHRLQELLRAEYGEGIEVVNAGVSGYTIQQTLKNLTTRVLQLDPDMIIVYHANNDIASSTRRLAIETGLIKEGQALEPGVIRFLSRYSYLVDLGYKSLKIQWGGNRNKLDEVPHDVADHFVTKLDEINHIARQRDIELVLSTFITKYRPDQDLEVQYRNADIAFYYMPWMSIEALNEALGLFNSSIVEFADEHGIPVVRDIDSIPPDDAHFVDCMHFANAGCEKMAQRFASFLIEQQLIAPNSTRPHSSQTREND